MHYKELNEIQKDKMKQISSCKYIMEWENPEFMYYLMGGLPKIRRENNDDIIFNELAKLDKLLSTYNSFVSDKKSFVSEIDNVITQILEKKDSWYGLNIYEIERYLKIHDFCLILGEGGVGKSYFIKCFEEQLEINKIEHLCLYGKFEKEISRIDIDEINKVSGNGFVFIYDAINEMSEKGQLGLLDILKELKKNPRIQIVITCRTNSLEESILKKYQELSEYKYNFPGVSFESALNEMLKMSVPDVYLYEDILYSNNALLLSMLCELLSSNEIVNEEKNSIASITFILEQYIKTTIKKTFKNNLTCRGVDVWEDTKRVAQWMYQNDEKQIDEKHLLTIIKTGNNFITSMVQMGFMDGYTHADTKYYFFVIDTLTDFLIARSLFQDIKEKDYQEQVAIIKSKTDAMYSMEEALIIAIFDNLTPNYKLIKNLLKDTELIEYLDYRTLVKVHFKSNDINIFKEIFTPIKHLDMLKIMGGFTDKPFNCNNYLFDYFCKSNERLKELSEVLAGYHFQNEIKNRLKNILYFITLNDREDRRDEEAFYFALLCCAAPNKDVRCLAMKLLYEVASRNDEYVGRIINEYTKILDFYIQEAVIYVLSRINKGRKRIVEFFNKIIINQEYLTAKSIRRIASYLGSPYSFIMWNRNDLYKYEYNADISDYLNDILFSVDLMNKDFLPFRYWGKNNIDMYTKFLANDKDKIKSINDYLYDKYSCVCGGECSGWMAFEEVILSEIGTMSDVETVDMNSFFQSFEKVFRFVFEYYGVSTSRILMKEEDFINSVYMKCVDLSTGIYYGSMMCNHYTNRFATFNNTQNSIGYEVYDPLEFGEEIFLTAPIPTYQDYIERLGDFVVSSLDQPLSKDINWVKDVELTRRNVLHLIKSVNVRNQEWVLLAGRVHLHEEDNTDTRWRDTYDIWCCSAEDETINDDGNARYLTIELEEYFGELKVYPDNANRPWLCKEVKNIYAQSDIFDETTLILPPAEIIKFFKLQLNLADMSWETQEKEKIILCNNNKNSYYKDPIGGTVFIRKDYYDIFVQSHLIKYFAFAERFIPETGFVDETSLHFEIIDGCIVKEIRNVGGSEGSPYINNPLCMNCPHTNIMQLKNKTSSKSDMDWLNNLLKDYGIDD